MIYLENRRYLPCDSDFRHDTGAFPSKECEDRPPPETRNYAVVASVHKAYDKAKNKYVIHRIRFLT